MFVKSFIIYKTTFKNYSSKCNLQNTLPHPNSYTFLIHEVPKAGKV